MFSEVMPRLAPTRTCIAPDYPGFGNSDPLPEGLSFPDLAEILFEVLEALDFETASIFGLHTGNKLGAAMAARSPELVDRFVLCGAPHSIIPDDARRNDVIRRRVSETIRTYSGESGESRLVKQWGDLFRRVANLWWDPTVIGDRHLSQSHIDRLATDVIETLQMRNSLYQIYSANFDYAWSEDLDNVAVPTLILELAHPEEVEAYGLQGDQLRDLISASEWLVVEDADVGTFYESPIRIADPVRNFLDG